MNSLECTRVARLRPLAAVVVLMLCAVGAAAVADPLPPAATPKLAPELAQLREQIAQLRQTLERLDGRLQQLENAPPATLAAGRAGGADATAPEVAAATAMPAPPAAPVSAPIPAPIAATPPSPAFAGALDAHQQAVLQEQVRTTDALTAWRGVRSGMRQEEVRRLLGEPQSTLNVGNRTGWIYIYRNAGKGSIFFDHDGAVVSLISPGQGAAHLY